MERRRVTVPWTRLARRQERRPTAAPGARQVTCLREGTPAPAAATSRRVRADGAVVETAARCTRSARHRTATRTSSRCWPARRGTDGDRVEVAAGLHGGERVVVSPPAGLKDGSVVTISASDTHGRSRVASRTSTSVFSAARERIDVLQGVNLDRPARRFPGADGTVRLRQDDAAQPARRPRPADGGHGRDWRRSTSTSSAAAALAALARPAHRLRLPVLQPAAGAHRRAQRRAAAAAHPPVEGRAAQARRRSRCKVVGLADRAKPLSAAALGRPGAARRHRPRDRHRPDAAALRRAHRRPRPQVRRRDPRPAPAAQPRARQDDRDGDARPARGRARATRTLHLEKGALSTRSRRHEVPAARLAQPAAPARCGRRSRSAVDLRRVHAVRLPDGRPRRVQRRRGLRRRRPADGRCTRSASSSPAGVATWTTSRAMPGVDDGDRLHLVRRRLPGHRELQFAFIAIDVDELPQALPRVQRAAPPSSRRWLADRQGAIVGATPPTRFGWKIGDRIPIQATISDADRGRTWYFNLDGIYDGDASGRQDAVLLPLRLPGRESAARQGPGELVRRQRIDDPDAAADDRGGDRRAFRQLAGRDQDGAGEGRSSPTSPSRPATSATIIDRDRRRRARSRSCSSCGNTMAQAVRERTNELAVLKTLGFSNGARAGAGAGASRAHAGRRRRRGSASASSGCSSTRGDATHGFLPVFVFTNRDIVAGRRALRAARRAARAPCRRSAAMRLRIIDALRRELR